MKNILSIIFLILTLPLFAQNDIEYTLYLFGDAGEPLKEKGQKNINFLKQHIRSEGSNSMVLLLGDNIYDIGIPDESHKVHKESVDKLESLLTIQDSFQGRMLFIPGNHDWGQGDETGLENVKRQEELVTQVLGDQAFAPGNGCPGPTTVELSANILLIIIDTQWVLHPYDKPNSEQGCSVSTNEELYEELRNVIDQNKEKRIIVASHHPLQTYGMHGGRSNFRQHVFPLTEVVDPLYLPLPIIGSIYPLYRKYIGNIQDVAHPKYQEMKDSLEAIFASHMGMIHVAGHEHSLQYSLYQNVHYVVSGSATKNSPVKLKGNARYAESETGFSKIVFYSDGRIELEIWPTSADNPTIFYLN